MAKPVLFCAGGGVPFWSALASTGSARTDGEREECTALPGLPTPLATPGAPSRWCAFQSS